MDAHRPPPGAHCPAGSVPNSQTIEERTKFWIEFFVRLARLANRVGVEERERIFAAIQPRIPFYVDDVRDFQLVNAEASERFWNGHRELWEGAVAGQEAIVAKAQAAVEAGKAQAAAAAAQAAEAKSKAERVRAGEKNVIVGKAPTDEDLRRIWRAAGVTDADLRHARLLASLPEDLMPVISTSAVAAGDRAARSATRKLVKLQRLGRTDVLDLVKEIDQEMRARGKSKSVL